jgi:anti-anti-sigma factor
MPEGRPFSLSVTQGSSVEATVISANGALVLENLFRFQDAWRASSSRILLFDLSSVDYMDSSAIGSLVNCHVHALHNRSQMALVMAPERVKQILTVTKVDSLFRFYQTVPAAEAALMGRTIKAEVNS